MTRERGAWLIALLLLALGAWWLSINTEWVEVERTRAARGQARDNPVYAFEQMMRRLGVDVAHHEALDRLPPKTGRLVLLSSDWDLIPQRGEQLRAWVQQGGHLVLPQGTKWEDTGLGGWVPVDVISMQPPRVAEKPRVPLSQPVERSDRTELLSTPPLWGETEQLSACDMPPLWRKLHADAAARTQWALTRSGTPQALRVAVGQGSVTVLNMDLRLFHNGPGLRCDNPLLLAAAVQAEPGAAVWIYLNEKREPLLPWLWGSGWIAIVIGLLTLAAALWRAAVRFGPRLAPAPRLRRSMAEQVRGLAAYLRLHGHDGLLAAQQRALDDVARRALRRHARLSLTERAQAIALATGLPAHELAQAMSARFSKRAELTQQLQLLETARRSLLSPPDERPL